MLILETLKYNPLWRVAAGKEEAPWGGRLISIEKYERWARKPLGIYHLAKCLAYAGCSEGDNLAPVHEIWCRIKEYFL